LENRIKPLFSIYKANLQVLRSGGLLEKDAPFFFKRRRPSKLFDKDFHKPTD